MKLLVIVNGWNCSMFVKECMDSLNQQSYNDFDIVIIDDNSSDNTASELLKYAPKSAHIINNFKNEGTANCRIKGQLYADSLNLDYEVVVWVDLDDIILPNALKVVADTYKEDSVWLTYGNFITKSTNKPCFKIEDLDFSDFCHESKNYRNESWKYIHLRTHRKELIYHLTPEDLSQDKFKAYPDINMLYCMLELAGKEHIKTISEPLYIYRDWHSNTCINRFSMGQRQLEKELSKKIIPKNQLESL